MNSGFGWLVCDTCGKKVQGIKGTFKHHTDLTSPLHSHFTSIRVNRSVDET